jgi:hypothetical protein
MLGGRHRLSPSGVKAKGRTFFSSSSFLSFSLSLSLSLSFETRSHYVAQTDLKLSILLPQLSSAGIISKCKRGFLNILALPVVTIGALFS